VNIIGVAQPKREMRVAPLSVEELKLCSGIQPYEKEAFDMIADLDYGRVETMLNNSNMARILRGRGWRSYPSPSIKNRPILS